MAISWKALSASVRGDVHQRNGLKNQDAVLHDRAGGATDGLLLAVADGHGSTRSFRSDRGSALAVECAVRQLRLLVHRHGSEAPLSRVRRDVRTRWLQALLRDWRAAVRRDAEVHPFSPLDFAAYPEKPPVIKPGEPFPPLAYLAYGTTLLLAAVTRHYIFYAQIGDGDILAVAADGKVSRPLQRHHEFYANQTSSLCTAQALRDFQVKVVATRQPPALLMLSTDGYANCFGTDASFHQVGSDFLSYLRQHGPGVVGAELEGWLRDSSRDGSGDDITVAIAARTSALNRSRLIEQHQLAQMEPVSS